MCTSEFLKADITLLDIILFFFKSVIFFKIILDNDVFYLLSVNLSNPK